MYSTGRWSRKSKTRHLSAINEGKSHVRKKENRNPREVANDIDNGRTMPMERRPAASARRRQVQMQTCPWGARVVNAYNIRRQCEPTLQAGLRYLVISWYWGSSLRVCVCVCLYIIGCKMIGAAGRGIIVGVARSYGAILRTHRQQHPQRLMRLSQVLQ